MKGNDNFTPNFESHIKSLIARCSLKADACRWAKRRRELLAEGADFETEIRPQDDEMIGLGRELGCYLWMCRPHGPHPSDLDIFDTVAVGFHAVRDALTYIHQLVVVDDVPRKWLDEGLNLLAEAQAALRGHLIELGVDGDEDQLAAYDLLRRLAEDQEVYVEQLANPKDAADLDVLFLLLQRLETLELRLEEWQSKISNQTELLDKLRNKAAEIAEGDTDWLSLMAIVDQLVEDGLQPSNVELRNILLSIIEDRPDGDSQPNGFLRVVREIEKFKTTEKEAAPEPRNEVTKEVKAVAKLLKGKSMLLIGADRRPHTDRNLVEAFQLKELIHIPIGAVRSHHGMKPYVERPDVAVIATAIRWSRTGYKKVNRHCRRHGKPLIRLLSGLSPNQVAHQILKQGSDRLGGEEDESGK